MFESLSTKLQNITASMRGKARVTEADIKDMMKQIRMALLEADVNYQVTKDFVKDMQEKCLNADIEGSFTPGQQIVKIVHESLSELLGSVNAKIAASSTGFTVVMLYGLQGAGKTTTAVKLANILKKDGKKPMVVSVDVHRPAAAEQLKVLADSAGIECYINTEEKDAVKIAKEGIDKAKYMLCNYLIVDTAGRTVVDDEMMDELKSINEAVKPDEKLLVVDAMIGQEAVNVAMAFEEAIGMDGFIMTKLDGDARGGAALSIRKMTGKPIKYICVGEKIDKIEVFHPDRMADRILGMGDVMSLIEKASATIDQEEAAKTLDKMMSNKFDLNDLLSQFEQMKKMGSMKDIIGLVPGVAGKVTDEQLDDGEVTMNRNIAIIRSMTNKERKNPNILNASRRKRIAAGSGTTVQDVNNLIRQYDQSAKLMKQMTKGGFKMPKGFPGGKLGGFGGFGKRGLF
ncbi:MAG: signal recognition particle protein [Clostridiales bacterium]|nr:signal recognition particle protein [Clostridiales bacterium]MBP3811428.1 signal recognition particle protein [Clostridiales bacterium]